MANEPPPPAPQQRTSTDVTPAGQVQDPLPTVELCNAISETIPFIANVFAVVVIVGEAIKKTFPVF